MAKTIHDVIKEKIAQILRFYGFTVKEESPAKIPEGGYGRVDVVGHKDSISVGVEVVDSGDVTRDAKSRLNQPLQFFRRFGTSFMTLD